MTYRLPTESRTGTQINRIHIFQFVYRWPKSSLLLLLCCLFSISAFSQTWIQRGSDIDGPSGIGWLGYSVSLSADGNTFAAGGPFSNTNGTQSGYAKVYTWSGSAWSQKGVDIGGKFAGDWAGYAVSLSDDGNTIAVGSPHNDGSGSNAGHVRVFTWNGSAWVQKGSDINGEAANDNSGTSVSLNADGNTLAIGAPLNSGQAALAGHVRMYEWSGAAWVQKGADINGKAGGDQSGYSVSMSADGNTVAMGSPYNDGTGTDAGQARVYDWDGSTWVKKGSDINGEAAGDESGFSVRLSNNGTRIAIGAPRNDGSGSESGQARVYMWSGAAWIQLGNDMDGEAPGDQAGYSVGISATGDTLAVGAPFNDGGPSDGGHVRLYTWNGASWKAIANDINGEANGDETGYSVAISDDGTYVASGAPFNDGNGTDAGHARSFQLVCDGYSNLNVTVCRNYTVPSGKHTYNTDGTYHDTIPNSLGCDSFITIHLTIYKINTSLFITSTKITAATFGAGYQWLDCNNNFAPIPGETGRDFTPTANGSYAVEITKNNCMDTSICVDITSIGIEDNPFGQGLNIYPNPVSSIVNIDLGQSFAEMTLEITNLTGQVITKKKFVNTRLITTGLIGPKGFYLATITTSEGQSATLKVLKK